jgi:hypothetical protein
MPARRRNLSTLFYAYCKCARWILYKSLPVRCFSFTVLSSVGCLSVFAHMYLYRAMASSLAPVKVSAIISIFLLALFTEAIRLPSNYDTVWTTQSANSAGSMPVGGGSVGLNAWAEDGQKYRLRQASLQK